MNIGMIGNLAAPHSTESDRKWSFEKLGHRIVIFQENKTTARQIKSMLPTLDLLVYSHTHGWGIPGLKELFKESKVPTVSVHLDRWAWLDREKDIGEEATWFTDHIFMADASPEAVELYEKHKLNWHYLAPGVVERGCYKVEPNPTKFPHDIIFTGSKNYHPEYPFRPKMIEFLQETYGNRFGHYGQDGRGVMRGESLNTLYQTAKIVVGDSCFGGRPFYVSDRYYEVRGRGGFLIHPHTEGIDTVGVGHYTKENLLSLKTAIDYWLENPKDREEMRQLGYERVKTSETYTQRAEQILKTIFP